MNKSTTRPRSDYGAGIVELDTLQDVVMTGEVERLPTGGQESDTEAWEILLREGWISPKSRVGNGKDWHRI